jgi:RimJ/RimL family protein N-acetyltransferase
MPPYIETPRLVLRPPLVDDADTLVRELNNFKISRNTGRIPHPYHMQDAKEFLLLASMMTTPSGAWAISIKPHTAALMGVISLDHDKVNDTVELGYWLSESVWANGYGSEAANAIVCHAFANLQLNELVSCFHNDNPVSGRILKRLGFKETGSSINFSRAQNAEVAVTNLHLTREFWLIEKGRDI